MAISADRARAAPVRSALPARLRGWAATSPWAAAGLGAGLFVLLSLALIQRYNWPWAVAIFAVIAFACRRLAGAAESAVARQLTELRFQALEIYLRPESPELARDVVEALLTETRAGLERVYREADEHDRSYLLSVALSPRLAAARAAAGSLEEEVAEALRDRALAHMHGRTDAPLDQVRDELARGLAIEVWFAEGLSPERAWYRFKRLPTLGDRATHAVGAGTSARDRFRQRVATSAREWDLRATDRLPGLRNVELVVGPAELPTAVIDVISTEVVGAFDIAVLAADPDLKARLGLQVTEYTGGWPLVRGATTHQKGYVRLEGVWRQGRFQTAAELGVPEARTPLDRTVPNYLRRGLDPTEHSRLNPLLADLMSADPEFVRATVRSHGNFVLEWRPVEPGSPQERYWLRLLPGDATMMWWSPILGGPGLQTNPDNYRHVVGPGAMLLPFSVGYLMTGVEGADAWLCIEVNVGSPGAATPEGGITRIETGELRRIVRHVAERLGVRELDYVPGTHGVVAHGWRDDERLWITLPEPRHVLRHRLPGILGRLRERGVLPEVVELAAVDRRGQAVVGSAGLLVVTAPELPLADRQLLAPWAEAGAPARLRLCRQLVAFAREALAADIVCVDFSLDQTALWGGRAFVCDYTAYLEVLGLAAGEALKKPEYEAPEDRNRTLTLTPESYMAFTVGLLAFQVLAVEPGAPRLPFPRALERRDASDPAGYAAALAAELPEVARHGGAAGAAELLQGLLAWRPEERPSLEQADQRFVELQTAAEHTEVQG